MRRKIFITMAIQFLSYMLIIAQENPPEWSPQLTETWTPVPEMVYKNNSSGIPSDAVILFDGNNLSQWEANNWSVEDGLMIIEPGAGGISTKDSFGDIQLHIEWRIPKDVDGESQRRGNSGIFLQGLYEIQILDSYNSSTYTNGQAGAVYKQHPPEVNASFPPGEWQKYDIFFEAPVFREDGKLLKPAFITVLHNGIFIQNNVEIKGPTIYSGLPEYEKHPEELPLFIQGSRHKLAFRNIWVRKR